MKVMTIEFENSELDRLVGDCQDKYPVEACGILLGTKEDNIKRVSVVFPTNNILGSETEYQINPKEQLDAFMMADELTLDVLGYYHSHPYWQAEPSETDRSIANQPDCSYIIYSNTDNEVRSFEWDGLEFRAEEIIVTEEQISPDEED